MKQFLGRLGILKEKLKSGKAEFVLLYGRRIGKSELIKQFLKQRGVSGVRLLAREESRKLQLGRFRNRIVGFFRDGH